jgi:hypothetical protein
MFSISLDFTDSFVKNGEINISKFGISLTSPFNFPTVSLALMASFKNSFPSKSNFQGNNGKSLYG